MSRYRLGVIANALGAPPEGLRSRDLVARIVEAAGPPDHAVTYLVISVMGGEIPLPEVVKDATRLWRSKGLEAVIRFASKGSRALRMPIHVETGVVIDLTDTAASAFTTGIQRVARETVARWSHAYTVVPVVWDSSMACLVDLSPERAQDLLGTPAGKPLRRFVVPFRGTLILPEIAVDNRRAAKLRSIARYAGGQSLAIGFDCIPVTTAETAGAGMPGAFSKYLSALARFDVVVPISSSAGDEYRGWKRMLSGAGLTGPRISVVPLPFQAAGARSADHPDETLARLGLEGAPLVVCVGSHEPRKNHLAVLHAAERVWRTGRVFSLVLAGGNSWDTERFDRLLATLLHNDRRVVTLSGVSDSFVWDLYVLARFSIFPSVNEGFGLPIVESLSFGTPVITSNFGSMKALGEGHGALLVDPSSVDSIAHAMMELLDNDEVLESLRREARKLPRSSWDDYSALVWSKIASDRG